MFVWIPIDIFTAIFRNCCYFNELLFHPSAFSLILQKRYKSCIYDITVCCHGIYYAITNTLLWLHDSFKSDDKIHSKWENMSLSQENINGRNKSLFLSAEHQPDATQTQNEVVFYFTELPTWCRQRHYRGGLQYAWQEHRLVPVMRLTVVVVVLEEGADEKRQKEIGEPLELEIFHALQKQDELRKNRVSSYTPRQSCSITVSKRLECGMYFHGIGEGSKAVGGVWAGQKAERESVDIRAEV